MRKAIVPVLIFSVFFSLIGCGASQKRQDNPEESQEVCPQQVPNPPTVDQFYENDPTYVDPNASKITFPMGTPESQGLDSTILAKAEAALQSLPQTYSFLVIRNGVLVDERYFHGSNYDQANNIQSASKTILSGLIGIALNKGLLVSVDQKISDVLSPDFTFTAMTKQLTLRHLLTMSAGISWIEDTTENAIEDADNWVQAILNLPFVATPGSLFNYDTGLTHLLSAVLTEGTGIDTCSFAAQYLFKPLGITIKHWGRDPQGYYSGGYNLYLTPRDLARVALMYLQKGEFQGQSVVPADWIAEATTSKIQSEHPQYTYGYLWWLFTAAGHPVYKMWGYGGQFAYLVPDLNLIMVTTTDTRDDYVEMDGDPILINDVIAAVTSKKK